MTPTIRETPISLPQGRCFVRQWCLPNQDAPAKAPILLIHDSLGCVELWRDFPAALSVATGRRVIAYDRLGFGQSDVRQGTLPLDFVAEEARVSLPALQEQLGFRTFVLFGHSVGGGMAVHAAAAWPEACQALITESAQAFVEDQTLAGIRAAKANFADPEHLARLARYHGDKARWVLDAWTETWLSPAFADWSLAAVLPEVRCPTLVLHGQHDEFGSNAHPERIAGGVSGPAQKEILPEIGHVPHRACPAQILDHVQHFLAAVA